VAAKGSPLIASKTRKTPEDAVVVSDPAIWCGLAVRRQL